MPRIYKKNCDTCGLPYKNQNEFYCSGKCRPSWNKGTRGAMGLENSHPNWKEDVGYSGVHRWLVRNFGKADCCENKECSYPRKNTKGVLLQRPKSFNWALLKGCCYEKVRPLSQYECFKWFNDS